MRHPLCPRCGNGWPTCRDRRHNGTRYTHAETCATYQWADNICADCEPPHRAEIAADNAAMSAERDAPRNIVTVSAP